MNTDSNNMSFVHLHSHSDYSIRDGAMKVKDYVKKVKELGMTACALTEHGNMHSAIEFYKECKKEGIKPILGVEAYVLPEKKDALSDDQKIKHVKHHITLLAKNNKGYKQLMKAVTKSQTLQDKKTFPRITYEDIAQFFNDGCVFALSGCIQGEIANTLLKGKYEEAKEQALFYKSLLNDNFFIELQNHNLPEEIEVLPQLITISRETNIPVVITNDCHYVNKDESKIRDMIVAMRFNWRINDPEFESDCGELYIKTQEEMKQAFAEFPEIIEEGFANTVRIAEECNVELKKSKRFPKFNTPDKKSEAEYIRELAQKGVYERFPDFDRWNPKYKKLITDRLKYELDVIISLHYEGYMLIVQDFIRYGKQIGIVGPGRGSAVGSLVTYLLGITDVNPLKYGLLFERFLNKDRVSDPDIDTDFSDCREKVIQYVKDVYGERAVCNIIIFGSMAARAAIRNAGRVTGKSLALCDRIAKMVPQKPRIKLKNVMDFELKNTEDRNPELIQEYAKNKEAKELIDDALLVEGLVTQTGVHAAGIIIADRDVSEYIPLLYDEKKGIWISQFDKNVCEEDIGLLKMDFLGLENLTIIKRTLEDIEKNHGEKLILSEISLDDKELIKEVFAKGKTKAVFQFESSGMVSLLKRFQPNSINDLILLNATYRPGPIQYNDDIIEVKHKRKKPSYICPQMKAIVDPTYGKPIYQEQIMRIFHEIAGFSLGESDIIRRAMGKKKDKELKKYLPKFKDSLVKVNVKPKDAENFCEELMEFSKYAFNKSHSTAYAIIAYHTAYLKYYFPVEYMANVLTSASIDELPMYIKECKDMGIPVLPPSINESGMYFTATTNKTIRFGLSGIKNAGECCKDIIKEREQNGLYTSIQDYIERLAPKGSRSVYKQVMESLIMTGAFDGFGLNRHQMMNGCVELAKDLKDLIKKRANPRSRDKTIADAKVKANAPHFDKDLPEYEKRKILAKEKELIGYYASGHPLDDYKEIIKDKANVLIDSIGKEYDGRYVTVVGQVLDLTKLYTRKDNSPMCKFILEDTTGEIEVICFPGEYSKYSKFIQDNTIVIVKGYVKQDVNFNDDNDNTTYQIVVNSITPVEDIHKVYLKIPSIYSWNNFRNSVLKFSGTAPLYIFLENECKLYKTKYRLRTGKDMKDAFKKLLDEKKLIIT
ncbi:MAG: DNA polymerase III subunit alpha [Candidatus Pacebacteria bacterium]|nr:DNA polymerase III subunit alpha [Candidatus Paceibacterota bacterium]